MTRFQQLCATVLFLLVTLSIFPNPTQAASDARTQYRVYQNANMLQEFSSEKEAIDYARKYAYSYVEEIDTRRWVFSYFPRFAFYEDGQRIRTYKSLDEAKQAASTRQYAAVRDLHEPGWLWHNYPRYQLYQGDVSLDHWKFATLEEAQQEARKWANAYIIDLSNNKWVWDNMKDSYKTDMRDRPNRYQVYQINYTRDEWQFPFIEDAIAEALKWEHSYIINLNNNNKVFSNEHNYKVYQYSKLLKQFINIDDAIAYAKKWDHATIKTSDDREIWTNYPYYQVIEADKKPVEFTTLPAALDYALQQPKAQIVNARGTLIWDNTTRLMYWAWTGQATDANIKKVVSETMGLDVISPTWFVLNDDKGHVRDTSSPELVTWLKEQGLQIHPLITNQFDSDLTTRFLSSVEAQERYIRTIVDRSAELDLDGINIDFENMKGSDRAAYTDFVRRFTQYAHSKDLKISIDLPRGSLAWNHLTAFDHAELAHIVDYIITMTYDHHYSGSPSPGPVAGLEWTNNGVEEFLSYGIPRGKLIMGIPFYIREWKLDHTGQMVSNRAIYSYAVDNIFATKQVTKTWDESYGQYKIQYEEDGYTHVFWLEDVETIKARLDIAKTHNIAGIAAWRLGQENPDFWQTMLLEK